MTKICTDLQQSKRLIELRIDINTADMYWKRLNLNGHISWKHHIKRTTFPMECFESKDYIPAWSLSALLGLMPKLYEFENDPDDGGCQPNLCKGWDNNLWHIVYRSTIYITEWHDEPIDAAFEMVVWLKENGKI